MANSMLTQRQEQILIAILREYVETAEPVSSGLLCEKFRLPLSSATIRTEMAQLENCGYLVQPFTSAGRIPTDKAYRYFVDNLADNAKKEISDIRKLQIRKELVDAKYDAHKASRKIARLLSEISDGLAIAGVVDDAHFYKYGVKELLRDPALHLVENVLGIAEFFDSFDRIFESIFEDMQHFLQEQELGVFIGEKNIFKLGPNTALVVTSYNLPGNKEGIAVLIGPSRMDYARNISLMHYVRDLMNLLSS